MEPKYGLSVTGLIHPQEIRANSHAKERRHTISHKAYWFRDHKYCHKGGISQQGNNGASSSNYDIFKSDARDAMQEIGVNGCTDITGFGLLGHAYEMAKASNVTIEIESKKVPIIEEAIELGEMGLVPGGAYSNKGFIEDKITWLKDIPEIYKDLLFDPQTSGGL